MAGITLAQAEARLTAWLAADAAVSSGQAYSIGGRSFTRADAGQIRDNIKYWNDWCTELSADDSGIINSQLAPHDQ